MQEFFQYVGTIKIHGFISQMTAIFVCLFMRTSNLTEKYILFCLDIDSTLKSSVFWDITVSRLAVGAHPATYPLGTGGSFPGGKLA
jgi:hypothetical protein